MVSIYRAEGQQLSPETFPMILVSSEERDRVDRMIISVSDERSTMTGISGKTNGTKPEELWSRENCTTPTAKEYRIPEVLSCPPAPRKRRDSSLSRLNSSIRLKEYFIPPPNFESVFVLDKISTVK